MLLAENLFVGRRCGVKIAGPLSFKIGGYEVNPNDGGEYGFEWGLNGAVGVLIPAEVDWNVTLGPQQLPGIYKIGGSYDTASLSDWFTATNGMPLPLTTAPPRQTHRDTFYVLGEQQIWRPDSYSGRGVTVLAGYEYTHLRFPCSSILHSSALWTSALSGGALKIKLALKLRTGGSVQF